MRRSVFFRGFVLLASSTGVIVGCSDSAPTEGNLPPTKVATPEDMEKLQQDLLQKKVADPSVYKAPPGVNKPRQ